MMNDVEKTKNEAQERTELRQKINRSLILEKNENKKIFNKEGSKKKERESLFSDTSQSFLNLKAIFIVVQYIGRSFNDVYHSTKDIVTNVFGKREEMAENTPQAIAYDKTLSILQELERQVDFGKKLDERILNDKLFREKICDIDPTRFEENIKILENCLYEMKEKNNYDIVDLFFKVWENEQKLREAQKDLKDIKKDLKDNEKINNDKKEKKTQGEEHSEKKHVQGKNIQNKRRNKK